MHRSEQAKINEDCVLECFGGVSGFWGGRNVRAHEAFKADKPRLNTGMASTGRTMSIPVCLSVKLVGMFAIIAPVRTGDPKLQHPIGRRVLFLAPTSKEGSPRSANCQHASSGSF